MKGEGKWITAYIELQKVNVSDIDVETILLNGTISVDPEASTKIDDYDKDDVEDLMIKFDRC